MNLSKRQFPIFVVSGLIFTAFLVLVWSNRAFLLSFASGVKTTPKSLDGNALEGARSEQKIEPLTSGIKFRHSSPFDTELRRKFIQSTDLAAFAADLQHNNDPDALFFRAAALQTCEGLGKTYVGESRDIADQRLFDGLKGSYLEQRRALLKERKPRTSFNLCRQFANPITAADVNNAHKLAAEAGDTRSQLFGVFNTIVGNGVAMSPADLASMFSADVVKNSSMPVTPIGPSKAQLDFIKAALASKDPTQILFAGPLLTAMYSEYTLEFGASNGKAPRSDDQLWNSIACHYGDGCDANNINVQLSCAVHGWCDVGSYDQMLQRYVIRPEKWEQFQKDRQTLISAIENKDWSLLREVRGPMNNASGTYLLQSPPKYKFRF